MDGCRRLGTSASTTALARALDDQALTRFVREALLEAHRAGSATQGAEGTEETADDLARRVEAAEAQLADALDALGQERARADTLERRLALVEERQAEEADVEQVVSAPEAEQSARAASIDRAVAEGAAVPSVGLVRRGAHRAGVVTLEPLDGEDDAFGEAGELVAEWRGLRGEDGRRCRAVDRARAEERRWQLKAQLIGEHGLALPPETEPLHPSRRDDQLRWRRVTLRRVRRERVRAERFRLLRRVLTLGLWRR